VFTFSWRITWLRAGAPAARRSCLAGLRRGGGRQAGAAVLSCLVWRCELTAGQVGSVSECVRRSHCAAGRTPTHAERALVGRSGRLNSHRHTRHDKTVLSVSCLAWYYELALTINCPRRGSHKRNIWIRKSGNVNRDEGTEPRQRQLLRTDSLLSDVRNWKSFPMNAAHQRLKR